MKHFGGGSIRRRKRAELERAARRGDSEYDETVDEVEMTGLPDDDTGV